MTLKVSIITAVFNRSDTIGHALQSVHSQSWKNIEHIVIDGGSTDGTVRIVESYRSKISVFISEPDKGIYDALNKGLSNATGDVVGFMHSDDYFFDSDVVHRIALAFSDDSVDGIYGDLEYVSKDNINSVVRRWKSGTYLPSKLARGWMPPHPTLYLRRTVFEKLGGFDTSYRIAADYEAILRYLALGKIRLAYIPEVLVKMRVGGESNRSLSRILLKSREDYRALHNNGVGGIGTLLLKNFSKITQFFK